MFIELDGDGPVYQQLTRALKAAILADSLGAGLTAAAHAGTGTGAGHVAKATPWQAELAHFMESSVGKTLKGRRQASLEGSRRHAGDRVRIADSHAGMHVLAWMPDYDHAQVDQLGSARSQARALSRGALLSQETCGSRPHARLLRPARSRVARGHAPVRHPPG
jgi:hypothetical protein